MTTLPIPRQSFTDLDGIRWTPGVVNEHQGEVTVHCYGHKDGAILGQKTMSGYEWALRHKLAGAK